jgi:hypothetical protein
MERLVVLNNQRIIIHIMKRVMLVHEEPSFFFHRQIRLAVKRLEFISDRVSFITLKVGGLILFL